jgi:xylan 1,4-beta-xylosidase
LPAGASKATVRHFRIDAAHSNAFEKWKSMGSPQSPTAEQYAALEAAGKLQELEATRETVVTGGATGVKLPLPRQAVSLIVLSW